jgi:AcrR family transcriptional regulator
MFTEMAKRPYKQDKRAKRAEETRQRIVEAIVELHRTVGPAHTSISAIADRAGVQRLTVYRHFEDDAAIFRACTSHYLALHPPPDPTDWQDICDAAKRSKAALIAMYGFYRRTSEVWHNTYRDIEQTPALRPPLEEFEGWLDGIRDDLLKTWKPKRSSRPKLTAVLRHALSFSTWESLTASGLSDKAAVEVVEKWLAAL